MLAFGIFTVTLLKLVLALLMHVVGKRK